MPATRNYLFQTTSLFQTIPNESHDSKVGEMKKQQLSEEFGTKKMLQRISVTNFFDPFDNMKLTEIQGPFMNFCVDVAEIRLILQMTTYGKMCCFTKSFELRVLIKFIVTHC